MSDRAIQTPNDPSPVGLSLAGRHTIPLSKATKGRALGVKLEERGPQMTGRIVRILYGHGHGFIRAADGRQLFFHRNDAPSVPFDALAVRDRVAFEVIEDKVVGPRAVKVKRTP